MVEKYLHFSYNKWSDLKTVQIPFIDDHQIPTEDFESKGSLSNDAARVVMKLFMALALLNITFYGQY